MPTPIVSVSGFWSQVGKTTLLCNLLDAFPGWEAIKISRGDHKAHGTDAASRSADRVRREEPIVLSGRQATYATGKDTGRYWDAGAGNVHWVIATGEQLSQGIATALSRVTAPGVFVEGNSFLQVPSVRAAYSIMVAGFDGNEIKSSAVALLQRVDAIFISEPSRDDALVESLESRLAELCVPPLTAPVFFRSEIQDLAGEISRASGVRGSRRPE